ncbi:hypothetical protein [Planococcus lenghuensis]|uniref:DUF3139 domain-containing protein n=1 Tax=Planococcus lenghuensis TaxID=2213202 RepID=A0A1Q2KY17_9BACL|nr:hypothetical protein [Planococcus lenghuensis]AQQ53115.1 hypothetical protein B0X71_08410 [Planococcus lenghuensis]
MHKIKIAGIAIAGTVIVLLIFSLFSPYNFFMKINEDSIINDPGIEILFSEEEINDVSYQGSNTYTLSTSKGEFVAVQAYYSVMNYKWHVYEKTDEWGG